MWDQIHIFFDVASAVGTVIVTVLSFYIRAKFLEMKDEVMDGQQELLKAILAHGGKCDAERAELFRTTNRIEGSGGTRRGREYFNDRNT
jgi:hypothetical protein